MDLETYHLINAWPELPTNRDEVLTLVTQGELVLDLNMLLYLWARSEQTP